MPRFPFPTFTRADTLALVTASAFFMEALDSTIIAPAIPEIANSFGVSAATVSSGISSYLIALAAFIPVSSWAAERFGIRNVFCTAIGVFTVASVLCGLSTSLTEFVLARTLQGIGGAMMSPVGRMEVLRRTPKLQFMRAMALISWPGITAFALGPLIGGFLTSYFTWHWIFFINVPLGVLGIALVWRYFSGDRTSSRPFDWVGFFLNGSALGCSIYGLELLGHSFASWPIAVALIVGGLTLGFFAIRHAQRHPYPLIGLDPAKVLTYRTGLMTAGFLFRITIGSLSFVLPVMLQLAFGMDAFLAGIMIFGIAFGDLLIKVRTTYFVRRFGFRNVLITNGWLIGISSGLFLAMTSNTPAWLIFCLMFLSGAVRSQQFTSVNAMAYSDIPTDRIANATVFANMLQQLALGFGVTFGAFLLTVTNRLIDGSGQLTSTDFRIVLLIITVISFAAVPFYLRLPLHAGANVSGHAPNKGTET